MQHCHSNRDVYCVVRSLTSYVARLLFRFPLFSLLSLDSSFDSYIRMCIMCVYIRCSREKKFPFPFLQENYIMDLLRISRSFFCPVIGRFLEIFDSITNKEIECNLVSGEREGDIDWSKRDYHQRGRIRGCLSIDFFTSLRNKSRKYII